MASIGFVMRPIKQDPKRPIREVWLHLNFRQRRLDPATTIALFITQVIDGNSSIAAIVPFPSYSQCHEEYTGVFQATQTVYG